MAEIERPLQAATWHNGFVEDGWLDLQVFDCAGARFDEIGDLVIFARDAEIAKVGARTDVDVAGEAGGGGSAGARGGFDRGLELPPRRVQRARERGAQP